MRFRVPSLFLSLYLGYNNLDNLYMRYIHRILAILFCLFFSTVSAQKVGLVLSGGGARALRTSVSSVHWRRTTFPSTISRVRPWEPSSARSMPWAIRRTTWKSLSNRKISNDGTPEGYRKNTSIISNGIRPHRNLSISVCH